MVEVIPVVVVLVVLGKTLKMEIISEKLKHFIIKETGLKKANITMETSLEKDLNIYGEEALDFIQHFSECFKVNISGFKIDEYFSSEGDIISKFFKKMFIPS